MVIPPCTAEGKVSSVAAVVGILLLMGKLVFRDLLQWAMVLANTYGESSPPPPPAVSTPVCMCFYHTA